MSDCVRQDDGESAQASQWETAYRDEIARLRRAVEARDRLIVTTARWLARPLPAMCSHIEDLANDQSLAHLQDALDSCAEHLAAMTRLSRGLEEIAGFVQLQIVLRPEELDLVKVARESIAEVNDDPAEDRVTVKLDGASAIVGRWDRLRVTRLFCALLRTAREQGLAAQIHLRLDDLGPIVRARLEFSLPHAPALTREVPAYGGASESDYDRIALQLWSAREIARMMGGILGISTWADARVIFTLDLPKIVSAGAPTPNPGA